MNLFEREISEKKKKIIYKRSEEVTYNKFPTNFEDNRYWGELINKPSKRENEFLLANVTRQWKLVIKIFSHKKVVVRL